MEKRNTFLVRGKKVKRIIKFDKNGKEKWTKFSPYEEEFGLGEHYIDDNPKENHFDSYIYGKKIKKESELSSPVPACIKISPGKDVEISILPKLFLSPESSNLFNKITDLEKAREYLRSIKSLD